MTEHSGVRRIGLAAAVLLTLWLPACGRNEAREQPPPPEPIRVGKESVVTVRTGEIRTGPLVSGELTAEREATVRAQVGGSIVGCTSRKGRRSARGPVLARIEARDLREAVRSADAGVTAAEHALQVARSEAQRTERLVNAGALATSAISTTPGTPSRPPNRSSPPRAPAAPRPTRPARRHRRPRADRRRGQPQAGQRRRRRHPRHRALHHHRSVEHAARGLRAVRTDCRRRARRAGRVHGAGLRRPDLHGARQPRQPEPPTRPPARCRSSPSIPNTTGRLIAGLFAEGRVETETAAASSCRAPRWTPRASRRP